MKLMLGKICRSCLVRGGVYHQCSVGLGGNRTKVKKESAKMVTEITILNYQEKLDEVVELISIADFVCIDSTVETTGRLLKNEMFNPVYMKDHLDCSGKWYDSIKESEKNYCLLDIGIAIFKRCPDKPQELEAEVYNIPILPACIDDNEFARFRGNTWSRVSFEGYGQEFVNMVAFDVNKTFLMGAPYLNKNLRKRADEYMKENPDFMVARRKRQLNPYLMPVVYKELKEKERGIIIERLKGVCKIFEAIIQCKIPLIGHHLLLKLIYIYKDFFEYLPDTYTKCIKSIRKLFPLIYDTKQFALDLSTFPDIPASHRERLEDDKLYELLRRINVPKDLESYSVFIRDSCKPYERTLEDRMACFRGAWYAIVPCCWI
ncbi:Poly(A)-specific ribonuclease PARN-like domain-containing protein 1 [Orchesella cincta]|uniref:Poly(A)-specific ribonuclease PARN-like domain-containing protein 1 n=1 Tax=Orchesella cincta TaxID=48709 RepID=A0A1D2NEC4_ORCCI|nr:Poly(A)-specific ribonuclease PARN-like domain-containing protein 1 [Orchesella cincta]